jgi:hypothetical protein
MLDVRRPRNLDRLAPVVAVALVAAVISFNLESILSTFDGGITPSAATFTLHGLLPYRDYWLLYGPLSGLVLALPTALLGPSVELSRAIGFAVFCAQGLVAYRIARVWAAPQPAIALAVASVVMVPAVISLDLSAWPLAMLLALAGLYVSIGTKRSTILAGLLIGLAFTSRQDVGLYALVAAVTVRDRRRLLAGFAAVAVPVVAFALVTTDPAALYEQLIWFPIMGTREFRSVPGIEASFGPGAAAVLSIPLVWLPRLAIVIAVGRVVVQVIRGEWDRTAPKSIGLMGLIAFAALCQLQTLSRADAEHYAQAATPAILLWAVWFGEPRLSPGRLGALTGITAASVVVGVVAHQFHGDAARFDHVHYDASAYIREATEPGEPIYVGLTSHRYAFQNPLLIYYLADRPPAVRDTLFNPGVTNTEEVQRRMMADLERTRPRYLVLDRPTSNLFEESNASRIAGSTVLDDYLGERYHPVCDLDILVIEARNDVSDAPPCPANEP